MRNKFFSLLIVFLSVMFVNVNASSCDYAEQVALSEEAANIKFVYEETTGTHPKNLCTYPDCDLSYEYFKINILNLSPNFYIEVIDSKTNFDEYYFYSDAKDGIISFDWKDISEVAKLTFNVYSTSETSCMGENYRVGYFTIPRFNPYSEYLACQKNPEYELCSKYVTFDDVSLEQFVNSVEKYQEEKTKEENSPIAKLQTLFDQIMNFISNNALTIVIVSVLVVGLAAIMIIIVKKRRSQK